MAIPRSALHDMAETLAAEGQGRDTELVHVNPMEIAALKRMGGSGTRNPRTGLLQFDPDGTDGTEGSSRGGDPGSETDTSNNGPVGASGDLVGMENVGGPVGPVGPVGGPTTPGEQFADALANGLTQAPPGLDYGAGTKAAWESLSRSNVKDVYTGIRDDDPGKVGNAAGRAFAGLAGAPAVAGMALTDAARAMGLDVQAATPGEGLGGGVGSGTSGQGGFGESRDARGNEPRDSARNILQQIAEGSTYATGAKSPAYQLRSYDPNADYYRVAYTKEHNFFPGGPWSQASSYAKGGAVEGMKDIAELSNMTTLIRHIAPIARELLAGDTDGLKKYAQGGSTGFVSGDTDGMEDKIPAKLSDGEYVIDAHTVAALGNGNNAAGAKKLDALREYIRRETWGKSEQPEQANLNMGGLAGKLGL